jgi:hypothetical protein
MDREGKRPLGSGFRLGVVRLRWQLNISVKVGRLWLRGGSKSIPRPEDPESGRETMVSLELALRLRLGISFSSKGERRALAVLRIKRGVGRTTALRMKRVFHSECRAIVPLG